MMSEETMLNCSVNHYYREGYNKGYADGSLSVTEEIKGKFINELLSELKEIEPYNWTDTDAEITEHNMWECCYKIVEELKEQTE